MNRFAIAVLLALAFAGGGILLERADSLERVRASLRSQTVPTNLLDYGTLGDVVKELGLVRSVPDHAHPPVAEEIHELAENVFRKRGKSSDYLYQITPAGSPPTLDSTLPSSTVSSAVVPLLSLAVLDEDLNDPERGIVANPYELWERRSHFSYYVQGALRHRGPIGLRLQGGASRDPDLFFNQSTQARSYRIYFRERYGRELPPDELFFGAGAAPVRTIVARRHIKSFVGALALEIARRLGAVTPDWRPVRLYMNGEDYGIYFLIEHVARRQWSGKLGHDRFLMFRRRASVNRKSLIAHSKLRLFAEDTQASASMEGAARYVDLDNMSRYLLSIIYLGTNDWEQGAALLDLEDPRARWTFVHWDLDRSFTDGPRPDPSVLPARRPTWQKPALSLIMEDGNEPRYTVPAVLFKSLVSCDPDYVKWFAQLASDQFNHRLTPAFLKQCLQRHVELARLHGSNHGPLRSFETFLDHRAGFVREDMRQTLGLTGDHKVLVTGAPGLTCRIDGFSEALPYDGTYFTGNRLLVELSGASRTRFSHFLVNDEVLREHPLSIEIGGPLTIIPVLD